jgi:hypothetical protein
MICKILRESALRFLAAEENAIAYWSNSQCSRGKSCPRVRVEFENLIKAELENLKATEKLAA